jgi:hypothetical protein
MSVITVTPTVELSNTPPRVRLNVADTGTPAFTSTTITRLNPDGTTSPVRTTDGGPVPISGGTGLVYDYEAPYGQAVTYSSVETPGNVTAPVTVAVSQVWLIHPGTPALSTPIDLRVGALDDETLPVRQAVYWPLGRSTPVVIGDGARKLAQSSLGHRDRHRQRADGDPVAVRRCGRAAAEHPGHDESGVLGVLHRAWGREDQPPAGQCGHRLRP